MIYKRAKRIYHTNTMKTGSRNLVVFFVLGFVIPQITLAAWWNPASWFKKKKVQTTEIVDKKVATSAAVVPASSTPKVITENKKQKEVAPQPKKQLPPITVSPIETPRQEIPKQEMAPETPKKETKNRVVSLPSGAVVELDARGDVVRTIKEVPAKTADDVVSDLSSQIDILKKQNEEAARQRVAQQKILEEQQKTLEKIKENTTPPPPPPPIVPEQQKPVQLRVRVYRSDLELSENQPAEVNISGGGCGDPAVFSAVVLDQWEHPINNAEITLTTPDGSITKHMTSAGSSLVGFFQNQPVARFTYNPVEINLTKSIVFSSEGLSLVAKVQLGNAFDMARMGSEMFEQDINGVWQLKGYGVWPVDLEKRICLSSKPILY